MVRRCAGAQCSARDSCGRVRSVRAPSAAEPIAPKCPERIGLQAHREGSQNVGYLLSRPRRELRRPGHSFLEWALPEPRVRPAERVPDYQMQLHEAHRPSAGSRRLLCCLLAPRIPPPVASVLSLFERGRNKPPRQLRASENAEESLASLPPTSLAPPFLSHRQRGRPEGKDENAVARPRVSDQMHPV